ncbi:hydrogen peroxide-dependent heme synthase [Hydrogenibacillus sp. N12]|uniref:hydrogen peroxide-dependent heme synthase n=1 Tax=Hydrogenibacillus sp. N12 TaxID=2866627 RepID=UPI001C7D1A6F|nr:hydrogen peroxide-dependent heme synthase [Hydrogenibacillus sp. N12]QZA32750.1 heme-dependent peroxidase [Hydrogenibacillus sp. N12]
MPEPAHTVEGWHVVHDFRTIDWRAWKTAPAADRARALEALEALLTDWQKVEDEGRGSYGVFQIVGQKADLLFLHFRPTLDELLAVKTAFNRTTLADFLRPAYGYYSIVELGGYTGNPEEDPWAKARLYPKVHRDGYVCFYPMSKKRAGADNWYMLPQEERARMMHSHGDIGKKFRGRVTQVISGSQGLDDWEWGVTLYAPDPIHFKKIIYEMRFDEVSARFGEFGPFYVGKGLDLGGLKALFSL